MQFPLSQRRHTNIAVVRYTKNGIKLEIACYKNKVISYRSGIEDRLDEVLQVDRIFTNVGRGFVASKRDIQAVFSEDMSQDKCIKFILDHGELQVAHQERTAEIDELFKDIAVMISQKCVHKVSARPFPTPVIEQSLRSIGATVKQDQPVKKQALSLMHQLIESQIIPITRAKMKVRCSSLTLDALHKLEEWCVENGAVVLEKSNTAFLSSQPAKSDVIPPSSETDGAVSLNQEPTRNNNHVPSVSILILLPPHLLRLLDLFVKQQLPLESALDMVDPAVMDLSSAAEVSSVVEQLRNGVTEEIPPQGFAPHSLPSFSTSSSSSEENGGKEVFSGYSRACKSISSDDDDDLKPRSHASKKNSKKKNLNKEVNHEKSERPRNAKPPRKELISSALQLNPIGDNDKDSHSDDGKKVKKGKKKRKGGNTEKFAEGRLSNLSPPAAPKMEDDSDAEAEVNRRQRKKLNKKIEEAPQFQSYDEEFFDYEGDEEEETKTL